MASNAIEWIGVNSWVSCRLEVYATANPLGNYSDVTAYLYGARNDGGNSYNHSYSNFWININGTQTSRGGGCQVSGSSWQLLHSQSTRVYHNDDGSKYITVSAGGGINDTTFQMGSNALGLTLDKIARKSTLTVADGVLGTSLELTINRQNDKYTDTITYKCGNASGTIISKTSDKSVLWTPPVELSEQNTTGTTVTVEFTVETFNGTTSLGSNVKKITCTMPDSVVPTVEISEYDMMSYFEKYGAYVQGKSVLAIDLTGSGVYGSSIASYSTTVDGKTYGGSTVTVSPLANSGELIIEVTVTDSRGRKGISNKTISVLAYALPKLIDVRSQRCDADGNNNSGGAYLKVSFVGEVTALNDKNSATYKVEYKKASESIYTTQIITDYTGVYNVEDGSFIFSADKYSTHDIIVSVYDDFTTSKKQIIGASVKKVFSILARGLGFAFGKVAELEDFLEVEFNAKFNKDVQLTQINGVQLLDLLHPVGSIYMSKDSAEPSVLFGGGAWERIKGRTFVGVDEEDEDFKEVGLKLGEKTHTLTKAEVPNATGSLQMHGAGSGGTNMQTTTGVFTSSLAVNGYSHYANAGAWSVGIVKFDLGFGDGAHNNIQPSYTVYAWVRTA